MDVETSRVAIRAESVGCDVSGENVPDERYTRDVDGRKHGEIVLRGSDETGKVFVLVAVCTREDLTELAESINSQLDDLKIEEEEADENATV